MPIVRDGSQIVGPEGAFDVAPACSGIRSLTALGAIHDDLCVRGI